MELNGIDKEDYPAAAHDKLVQLIFFPFCQRPPGSGDNQRCNGFVDRFSVLQVDGGDVVLSFGIFIQKGAQSLRILCIDVKFIVARQKSYRFRLFRRHFEDSGREFVFQVRCGLHHRQDFLLAAVTNADAHIDVRDFRFVLFDDINLDFRNPFKPKFLLLRVVKIGRIHEVKLEFFREGVIFVQHISDIPTNLRYLGRLRRKVSGDGDDVV